MYKRQSRFQNNNPQMRHLLSGATALGEEEDCISKNDVKEFEKLEERSNILKSRLKSACQDDEYYYSVFAIKNARQERVRSEILSGKRITKTIKYDIAEEYNVSIQTIYKDLREIKKELGITGRS